MWRILWGILKYGVSAFILIGAVIAPIVSGFQEDARRNSITVGSTYTLQKDVFVYDNPQEVYDTDISRSILNSFTLKEGTDVIIESLPSASFEGYKIKIKDSGKIGYVDNHLLDEQ